MFRFSFCFLIVGVLYFLSCVTPPTNPADIPSNAYPEFTLINGDEPEEPISVPAGQKVSIEYSLYLPQHIDSITLVILGSGNDTESVYRQQGPWDSTLQTASVIFTDAGTGTLKITAYTSNGDAISRKLIFNVTIDPDNKKPQWIMDTLEFYSAAGEATPRDCNPYVTDPDSDSLFFFFSAEIPEQFTLSGPTIISVDNAQKGTYHFPLTVTDGNLRDTAMIVWEIFTRPLIRSGLVDDTAITLINTPLTLDVLDNDTVIETPVLSYLSQGEHGSTILHNGLLRYTPETDFTGNDELFYIVNATDTARVFIEVVEELSSGSTPVWKSDTVRVTSYRNDGYVCDLSEYTDDNDSDQLTFTISDIEGFDLKNGTQLVRENDTDTGTYVFEVILSDGEFKDTCTVLWVILPPHVQITDDKSTVIQGTSKTINVLENDKGVTKDLIIVEVTNGTLGSAKLDPDNDSCIVYTAQKNASGKDTVFYLLSSGDTGAVIISVTEIEYHLNNDSLTLVQGGTRSVSVLTNDSVSHGDLTVSHISESRLGSATIDDNEIIFSANDDAKGNDTITYYVNDKTDSATLVITVLPITIITRPDSITVDEDGETITVDVLDNDSISSGKLTLTGVSGGSIGETKLSDGKVAYTPNSDKNGSDTIIYTVNDAETGKLVITVTPRNDPPEFTATIATVSIFEDEDTSITLSARDMDGTPVVLTLGNHPEWITISLSDNAITIHLNPDKDVASAADAPVQLPLVVTGVSENDTIEHSITVSISNVNRAPRISMSISSVSLDENEEREIAVSAEDDDGDHLELSVKDKPEWVSSDIADNTFTLELRPDLSVVDAADQTADFTITLEADDGTETVSHTITVTVSDLNQPPVFTAIASPFTIPLDETVSVSIQAADPEGSDVTLSVVSESSVAGAAFINQNTLRWTADRTTCRPGTSYPIVIRATDGETVSDTAISIAVSVHEWASFGATITREENESTPLLTAFDSSLVYFTINVISTQSPNPTTELHTLNPSFGIGDLGTFTDWSTSNLSASQRGLHSLGNYNKTMEYGIYTRENNLREFTSFARPVYSVYGKDHTPSGENIYYIDLGTGTMTLNRVEDESTSDNLIINSFANSNTVPIAAGNEYTWMLFDGSLYYLVEGAATWKSIESYSSVTGLTLLECDMSGSTVYAAGETNPTTIYRDHPDFTNNTESIPLDPSIGTPAGFIVLSEDIVWFWTTDGDVYFTNDGFEHTYKEIVPTAVSGLFRAADGKSVFGYHTEDQATVVYRY